MRTTRTLLALTACLTASGLTRADAPTITPLSMARTIFATTTDKFEETQSASDEPAKEFADFDSQVNADYGWTASQASIVRSDRLSARLDASGFFDPPVLDGFASSEYELSFSIDEATPYTLAGRVGGLGGHGAVALTQGESVIAAVHSNSDGVEDPYVSVPFFFTGELQPGAYAMVAGAVTSFGPSFAGGDVRLELLLGPAADFDRDGDVDGADFLVWQENFGTLFGATREEGDTDGDTDVDGDDFLVWQNLFAPEGGRASTAVPEPATWLLVAPACSVLLLRRHVRYGRSA